MVFQKGYIPSTTHRQNLSKALKGRKLSKETCLKMSKNRKGRWLGGGPVKKICVICKKEFIISRAYFNLGIGKFCSKECMGIWQSRNRIGQKSSHWKGGITSHKHRIRESIRYKQWRQSVFIRDDFTCQKCGQNGGQLNAHHKKPFHELLTEVKMTLPLFNLYDGVMIYTPFWDTQNGMTLCKKCHKKINNRR